MTREEFHEHLVYATAYRWEDQSDLFNIVMPVLFFFTCACIVVTIIVQAIVIFRVGPFPTAEERERYSWTQRYVRGVLKWERALMSRELRPILKVLAFCWAATALSFGATVAFMSMVGVPSTQ
ncbi:MAG: hypothetical protein C0606_07220 [Hyphomicrobiales bacterium]|nr:MAG: hypothetical protein C0606_07220 [Hyphomicrobiales bacterium]